MVQAEEKMCRYNCGIMIKWVPDHKMPIEVSSPDIEHTFKRCAEVQKSQNKKPFFYDR